MTSLIQAGASGLATAAALALLSGAWTPRRWPASGCGRGGPAAAAGTGMGIARGSLAGDRVMGAGLAVLVAGMWWRIGPVAALAAAVLSWGLAWVHRGRCRMRARERERASWLTGLARCAAELRAGATVADALRAAGARATIGADGAAPGAPQPILPAWPRRIRPRRLESGRRSPAGERMVAAAGMVEVGGHPWALLRDSGSEVGRALAACLAITETLGVAPSPLVRQLAQTVEAQANQDRGIGVALASAQATGRLLAALPLAGLGLAAGLGASAPRFLFGPIPGQLCLLAAAILETAGMCWLQRLASPGE